MGVKLIRWAIFSVLISLSPFGIAALNLWSGEKLVHLSMLWPHGELLLISTALASDAVGNLVPGRESARKARVAVVGSCVLILISTALWYGLIQGHPEYKADRISQGSIFIFLVTLIVCASSLLIE